MSIKRALLIGVGDYLMWPSLSSNYNDVQRLNRLLQTKFEFFEENIVTLNGSAASKSSIIQCLKELVAKTEPNHVAVLTFSGHGGRFDDKKKLSGYSETIVPYDADDTIDTHICDNELRAILESFQTANVTVILDSCHSGGATRGNSEVCTYLYVYICMYVCMYVYMYVCMYVCIHECVIAHVYMYESGMPFRGGGGKGGDYSLPCILNV